MNFQAFEVGRKVCQPTHKDESIFDVTEGGAILLLKFRKPSSKEKNSVKSGVASFRAVMLDGVVFFLARFGTGNWIDAPYNRYTSPGEVPPVLDGSGIMLHVMLIDADTGILVAQRVIGLSTEFTKSFRDLVEVEPEYHSMVEFQNRINTIYSRYSTNQMVEMAGVRNE